jgi:hypothetical protein
MNFLEKDLEQIIWESDNEKLRDRNLNINGKKIRQLRIGNYGILDLLTVEKSFYWCEYSLCMIPFLKITVYELKKEKVGISAFLQASRYCKGISKYLEKRKPFLEFRLNICLVAKEVDTTSDFIFFNDIFDHSELKNNRFLSSFSLYSFKFDIDGILFQAHKNYSLIDEGF